MERPSFESIATGRPIAFKIGRDGREFFMHSSLLASLSPPLDRLVNGSWSESVLNTVVWEEVDEATFVHFCQFAYTGDYQVQSSPTVKHESMTVLNGSDPEVAVKAKIAHRPGPAIEPENTRDPLDDHWTFPMKSKKTHKSKALSDPWDTIEMKTSSEGSLTPFPERFQSALHLALADKHPKGTIASHKTPLSEVATCYSYGDIFLSHARIFVFADCYGIHDLSHKALNNLHQALVTKNAQSEDVMQIFEYCIDTTLPESLRDVILAYVACKASGLWLNTRFQELLQRDSGMVYDLLDLIMKVARP